MTSKGACDKISGTIVDLVSGSNKISITPSPSMISDIPFIFPPDEGGLTHYLRANGSGVTQWADSNQILIDDNKTGPAGNSPSYHPPSPVADLIRVRTSELLTIDLTSGDTPGGSLTNPTAAITSITILQLPTRGTLTALGPVGQYTYRSYPRYRGYDSILYSITDSNGIVSKSRGFCFIDVTEGNAPFFDRATGVAGTYFTYGSSASNKLRYYKNGTDTVLRDLAANVGLPIDFGNLTINGTNSNATNRDDSVMYFCNADAALLPATQRGRVYGWDYANDILFLVVDVINDAASVSKFDPTWDSDLSSSGAEYVNKTLYVGCKSTTVYYRITLGPYDPTSSGASNL